METEKLRPSLSWGDALLFINKQDEKIKELQDEIERLKNERDAENAELKSELQARILQSNNWAEATMVNLDKAALCDKLAKALKNVDEVWRRQNLNDDQANRLGNDEHKAWGRVNKALEKYRALLKGKNKK